MDTFEQLADLSVMCFSSSDEAITLALQQISNVLGMRTTFLSHIDQGAQQLQVQTAYNQMGGCDLPSGAVAPLAATFCSRVAQTHAPVIFEDLRHDPLAQQLPAFQIFPHIGSYLGVPVFHSDGRLYGTLCAVDQQAQHISSTSISLLIILARLLVTQIEREQEVHMRRRIEEDLRQANTRLQEAYQRLETVADTDPLTGLLNRRALMAQLDPLLARSRRSGDSFAVCIVDVDHFKRVNDTYGHPAGDTALAEMGLLLRNAVRIGDLVGRWGGEEFLVVLNNVTEENARDVAERLRRKIAANCFSFAGGKSLTASIGVALYPQDATEPDMLTEKADQALYQAKQHGRNLVQMASKEISTVSC